MKLLIKSTIYWFIFCLFDNNNNNQWNELLIDWFVNETLDDDDDDDDDNNQWIDVMKQSFGVQRREHDGPVQPGHLFRTDAGARSRRQRSGPVSESGQRAHQEHHHQLGGHLPAGRRRHLRAIHIPRTRRSVLIPTIFIYFFFLFFFFWIYSLLLIYFQFLLFY